MRQVAFILVIMSVFLAACGGQTPPTATQLPTQPSAGNTGGAASALADYVPSDPAQVGTTGRPQVVEFFAFKDGTSQAMRPVIHRLQDQYGTMVDFIYLNTEADNTKDLQKKFNITGQGPTIILFDEKGTEKCRFVGMHNLAEVETEIEDLIAVG